MKMDGICMVVFSNFVVGELAMVYKGNEPNLASQSERKVQIFFWNPALF
jgi:hypothetical protein